MGLLLIQLACSTYRHRSQTKDDTALWIILKDLAASRVRYGYRRLHVLLLREGWRVDHKKVCHLYQELGLSFLLAKSESSSRIGPKATLLSMVP